MYKYGVLFGVFKLIHKSLYFATADSQPVFFHQWENSPERMYKEEV